jgi:DnaK suppressor protein
MTLPSTALTAEQLGEIREELRKSLARLERSMKSNGNGRPPELDQSAVGRLSRIEALQNQGMTQNLQERERLQLEQVMDALKRLEAGTFGYCTDCRGPIRFDRLLVFPEALNCTSCGSGN